MSWANDLKKFFAGVFKGWFMDVCQPNDLLLAAGLPNRPIKVKPSTLQLKVKKHGLTSQMLKRLNADILNPVMIFRYAKSRTTLNVIIRQRNEEGCLCVSIRPEDDYIEINNIATIHGRTFAQIELWANAGLLIYADKEKTKEVLVGSGITCPKSKHLLSIIDVANLQFKNDMSKYFDEKLNGVRPDSWYEKEYYDYQIDAANSALKALSLDSETLEFYRATQTNYDNRRWTHIRRWGQMWLKEMPIYPFLHILLLHNPEPVLDIEFDSAEKARARGYRKNGSRVFLRQNEFPLDKGVEHSFVRFTDEVKARFVYALIPVYYLQPSHVDKQANPVFFINEAQPKNRVDDVSQFTAERHAADIHPDELLACPNAYSGAPIVNGRGEVIQGNGRANALRIMFERYPKQARKYNEAVSAFCKVHTGLVCDDVQCDRFLCSFNDGYRSELEWEQKALVRVLVDEKGHSISDNEAIRYGQYTDTQMTTGGQQKFNAMGVARQILANGEMSQLTRILFSSEKPENDERTLSEYLSDNGADVISWLALKKYITPAEAQTCYARVGAARTVSNEGREGLRDILSSILFAGASDSLAQRFAMIPVKAQVAILTTIDRDIKMPDDKKLVKDIQEAIEVCQILMSNKASGFPSARTFEAAKQAVRFWQRQSSMTNDGQVYYPADRYGSLSLALAACFKGMAQNDIRKVLNDLYDRMTGTGGSLFDDPDDFGRAMTKTEAAKVVLGVETSGGKGLGRATADEPTIEELRENISRYRELRNLDDTMRRDADCVYYTYIEPMQRDIPYANGELKNEMRNALNDFANVMFKKNREAKKNAPSDDDEELQLAIAKAKAVQIWLSLQKELEELEA